VVPEDIRTAVRNNGGGHYNHSLFWTTLKKNSGAKPAGELGKAIDAAFGSYSVFQDQFTKAATSVFSSGWAWLNLNPQCSLEIETSPNQDCPLTTGHQPVFGIDVWEHAYYLKYQNKRPDYVAAFYNVIDWEAVGDRYVKLRS
jgi:superoxide dismutase, Fe-Mn family